MIPIDYATYIRNAHGVLYGPGGQVEVPAKVVFVGDQEVANIKASFERWGIAVSPEMLAGMNSALSLLARLHAVGTAAGAPPDEIIANFTNAMGYVMYRVAESLTDGTQEAFEAIVAPKQDPES